MSNPASATRHPSADRLRHFARGEQPADDEVDRHLLMCADCRTEISLVDAVEDAMTGSASGRCPPPDLLVRRSVGEELAASQAAELDAHVQTCLQCADDLEALTRADGGAADLPGPPSAGSRALRALRERLRDLVRFDMPVSLAVTARSAAAATGPAIARGFEAYRAGRYDDAREALDAAYRAGDQDRDLPLFLGACLLHDGRAEQAVATLREAVRRNPRLGQHRWYLAQALLLAGDGDAALTQLDKAAALPGRYKARARKLRRALQTTLTAT